MMVIPSITRIPTISSSSYHVTIYDVIICEMSGRRRDRMDAGDGDRNQIHQLLCIYIYTYIYVYRVGQRHRPVYRVPRGEAWVRLVNDGILTIYPVGPEAILRLFSPVMTDMVRSNSNVNAKLISNRSDRLVWWSLAQSRSRRELMGPLWTLAKFNKLPPTPIGC